MGYHTTGALDLDAPFRVLHEFLYLIPKGSFLPIEGEAPKILFFTRGEILLREKGRRSGRAVAEGSILCVPTGVPYEYLNTDPHRDRTLQVVRLMLRPFSAREPRKEDRELVELLKRLTRSLRILPGPFPTEVRTVLEEFRREIGGEGSCVRILGNAMARRLAVAVHRVENPVLPRRTDTTSAGHRIALQAKEYVMKNLSRDFSLAEVALSVEKGREHLTRVFREETGMSLFAWVRKRRVEKAKNLLLIPTLTLAQIARECGFAGVSYFGRSFRLETGRTPSAHRREGAARVQAD